FDRAGGRRARLRAGMWCEASHGAWFGRRGKHRPSVLKAIRTLSFPEGSGSYAGNRRGSWHVLVDPLGCDRPRRGYPVLPSQNESTAAFLIVQPPVTCLPETKRSAKSIRRGIGRTRYVLVPPDDLRWDRRRQNSPSVANAHCSLEEIPMNELLQ